MNKRYRIDWSEFRHAFIFTLENTVTQGKSSFTRKAVVQAVSAGLLALGGGQALATDLIFDSSPSAITTVLTADNSLLVGVNNPGVSLTIGAGGSVTVNPGGNSATLGVSATSDENSLNVTGRITGSVLTFQHPMLNSAHGKTTQTGIFGSALSRHIAR